MDPSLRVVTRLPLQELWRDNGFTTTSRVRWLTQEVIAALLRNGPVQFVAVDVGSTPNWIPIDHRYSFWKDEVKPHLAEPDSKVILDTYPGNYCYLASEWDTRKDTVTIVVLERRH